MKKSVVLVSFFLILTLLCGCYSTKDMVENPIVTDTSASIADKMDALGFPRASIRKMEAYFDGPDWVERVMELVENAQDYVIIASFLVSECEENGQVYDLLCKRAEEGLEIYFIYDSAAAMDMTASRFHMKPVNRLAASGVHVLEFSPFSINRLPKLAGMLLREHRKFYIIDGRIVAVGGMNLNYISNRSSLDDGQRDSMFCFESETTAKVLLEDFVDFWNTYSWEEVSMDDFYVPEEPQVEDAYQAWIINQFDRNKNMVSTFGSIFYSAKEEVLILPLLPMENSDTRKAISDAVQRGVDVQMILPNDPRESVYRGAHYSVSFLMETGMSIYPEPNTEERKNLLHEKTVIVDGEYVLLGSANFNYRSLVLSNEVGIMIHNPEFAQFMTEHYMTIKDGCELITPEQAEQWHKITWILDFLVHFILG